MLLVFFYTCFSWKYGNEEPCATSNLYGTITKIHSNNDRSHDISPWNSSGNELALACIMMNSSSSISSKSKGYMKDSGPHYRLDSCHEKGTKVRDSDSGSVLNVTASPIRSPRV